MSSKDMLREFTEEYDGLVKEHLIAKRTLLENEKKLKLECDFTPLDAVYEYEKSNVWKEHLKTVAVHNIDNSILNIVKQLKDLEIKAVERQELDKLEQERKKEVK